MTVSVLDENKIHKRYIITEEKLDDICAQMEASQRKRLRRLAVPCGVSKCSAHKAMPTLLNLLLCKIRILQVFL